MVKKNSKVRYVLFIQLLILCIYVSLFFPFYNLINEEIIKLFTGVFIFSLSILSTFYLYNKPLITLFGSIILLIIIAYLIINIVNITNDFFIFFSFVFCSIFYITWVLVIIYDVKKGNIHLK